jgi:hypothetical protein
VTSSSISTCGASVIAAGAVEAQRMRPYRDKRASVSESPLAKSVTSCPRLTSSSVRKCDHSLGASVQSRRERFQ